MRVVLDTSVLVAAERSKHGASHALVMHLPDARFQPVISVALFAEYRAALLRPENLLHRSPAQAESFLDFLLSVSHLQEVFFLWRPSLPDPDDDWFLSWQWPPVAVILLRTISEIFGERKNGESRR